MFPSAKFAKVWQSAPNDGMWNGFQNVVKEAVASGATMDMLDEQFLIAATKLQDQLSNWTTAACGPCFNLPGYAIMRDPTNGVRKTIQRSDVSSSLSELLTKIRKTDSMKPIVKASAYLMVNITFGFCAVCQKTLAFSPGGGKGLYATTPYWKGLWFNTTSLDVRHRAETFLTALDVNTLFSSILGICGVEGPYCNPRCHSCTIFPDVNLNIGELSGWKTSGMCLACGNTGLLALTPPKLLTGRWSEDREVARRYHEKFKRLRK